MEDYTQRAISYCEEIGIYEYQLKDNKLIYYSYFGKEGLYKVTHYLDTDKETRAELKYKNIPNHLKGKYNYFVG